MPPSHHSSSHHSSSHHSSSHHSGPSHHSSSSHHSSYRSGPSFHSGSSHSSNVIPAARRREMIAKTKQFESIRSTAPFRYRVNQPAGYRGIKRVTKYVCATHEYYYYPESWQDESSGMSYEKGYYDEFGNRYDSMAFSQDGNYVSLLRCDYCETEVKLRWSEGAAPYCPNCGAPMSEKLNNVATDRIIYTSDDEDEYNNFSVCLKSSRSSNLILPIILISLFVLPCFVMIIVAAVEGVIVGNSVGESVNRTTSQGTKFGDDFEDSIYVEEIGRECKYLSEYESYYDKTTDCYFWYNSESEPAQWQYWYEGISSYYGDYGWMEYDESEEKWYIEVSESKWEKLPDKYYRDDLWHIEDDSVETDKWDAEDSIYVEEIGRECEYISEFESYYDEETDCYFWHNTDISPAQWQYWYEGISSDYGDYGWMEYDEEQDEWYIEVDEDEWEELPNRYDRDDLWHIEE